MICCSLSCVYIYIYIYRERERLHFFTQRLQALLEVVGGQARQLRRQRLQPREGAAGAVVEPGLVAEAERGGLPLGEGAPMCVYICIYIYIYIYIHTYIHTYVHIYIYI